MAINGRNNNLYNNNNDDNDDKDDDNNCFFKRGCVFFKADSCVCLRIFDDVAGYMYFVYTVRRYL